MGIPPLAAGNLRDRVTIERNTPVESDTGNKVPSWAPLATVWAQVRYGTGRERREAAQESASTPATIIVRRNSTTLSLTPADRLNFGGAAWDIVSAVPRGLDGIEITAIRRA